jgi:YidC/Oxa1 family membrane protein insertase
MANLRPILFMGLLVLSYLMWVEWQKDYGPQPQPQPETSVANTSNNVLPLPVPQDNSLPSAGDLPEADAGNASVDQQTGSQAVMTGGAGLLTVTTDVLEVGIDLVGGTVVTARLLDYPVELEVSEIKVDLLNSGGPEMFIAQSGLLSRGAAPNHTSNYRADVMQYELGQSADEIRVPLTWEDGSGVHVTKTFIFKRGEYDIRVRHTLSNESGQSWSGSRYDQLQRSVITDRDDGGFTNPGRYSFFGIGFYSPDEKFEKVDFDDVASEPYKRSFSDGWLSMVQHYFFTAWIPPQGEVNSYSTQVYSPAGFPGGVTIN